MRRDMPIGKLSRETLQRAWPAAALVTTVVLVGAWFLQSTIPRHVVLASGLKGTGCTTGTRSATRKSSPARA